MTNLAININEKFPHLSRAPIIEAVIDIRARASVLLEEGSLKDHLMTKLDSYQFMDSMQHFQIQHKVNLQGGEPIEPVVRELDWKGLRFQSDDRKHIAQFNRDGFVFSRLEPYESWEQLYGEGLRLWCIYIELARPIEIHRLGLRYINRIQLPPADMNFEDYLEPAPAPPKGLGVPFYGFMHQDTLAVPDHPYAVNVIRTIQTPGAANAQGLGLILDIDAFTMQGFELDAALLEQRLCEMRWLKNKVFFGSVTAKALKLFQ